MRQSRCIFCMSETGGQDQICPVCKRGIWEYQWKESYLEPYTKLREKYLAGAALEEDGDKVRYMGYDLVLDQKVLIYAYPSQIWERTKKKEASLLFGRFTQAGITAVKDYFSENGRGYMITSYAEGIPLEKYLKTHGRIAEERAGEMLLPAVRAVNMLHAAGLVHGNINPAHLFVTEESRICLLADCIHCAEEKGGASAGNEGETKKHQEAPRKKTDNYAAPELFENEGILGPWTDVYAFGSVWYEMITGHRPESASSRGKRGGLKKPSRYAEISQRTEEGLMQALAPDPQTRFFYLGNFLESMGLPWEELDREAGAVRHHWGNAWLEAAERTKERKNGRWMKGYVWKRLLAAAAALFCLAGAGGVGIYAYIQTHQPEYFQWKLEQARKKTDITPAQGIFEKDDEIYDEVKDFILKYGEREGEAAENPEEENERRNFYYELEETDAKNCPAAHTAAESFYLDYRTAKMAVQYYMDIKGKMDLSETSFYGSGYIDNNEDAAIAVFMNKEERYKVRLSGEEVDFRYDLLDGRLTGISFQGTRERCAYFLEKMTSLFAPETFLAGEEAEELMEMVPEEGAYIHLRISAKHEIIISHRDDYEDGDKEIYEAEIKPQESSFQSWYGVYLERVEAKTAYAGNYDRGGSRYQEFADYVKEHAVSQEKAGTEGSSRIIDQNDGEVYTLKEEDVLKWGEPCNDFRFSIKSQELVDSLKNNGYEMTKLSEKRENTVELQKYGAILTRFHVLEHYLMEGDICLAVVKDLVNEDVIQMMVYRKEGSGAELEEAAADAAMLAGEFEPEDRERLVSDIREWQQTAEEENDVQIMSIGNVIFMNEEYKNTGTAVHIVPIRRFDGASYYWP